MVLIYLIKLEETASLAPVEAITPALMFSVTVFGAVRPGTADEDGAVSVLHRAAV